MLAFANVQVNAYYASSTTPGLTGDDE